SSTPSLTMASKFTVVSSDGKSFEVERKVLKQSVTIETLIAGLNLDEADSDTPAMPIPLPNVTGDVLEKVIKWCEQHQADPVKESDENVEVVIPDWDKEFIGNWDRQMLLQITVAANYLDIKSLLDMCCKTIANTFANKSGEEIRADWGVKNEFTPEEEAAIKKENEWCE
ncbi:hypothetical protein PMAYCL1PPCAC_21805, partial [Pristionchus mayeri]